MRFIPMRGGPVKRGCGAGARGLTSLDSPVKVAGKAAMMAVRVETRSLDEEGIMNANQHLPSLPDLSRIRRTKINFLQQDGNNNRYEWGPYYDRSGNNGTECLVYIIKPTHGFPSSKEFIVCIEKNTNEVRFICDLPDEWRFYIKYEQYYPKPPKSDLSREGLARWDLEYEQWKDDYYKIEQLFDDYFEKIVQKF